MIDDEFLIKAIDRYNRQHPQQQGWPFVGTVLFGNNSWGVDPTQGTASLWSNYANVNVAASSAIQAGDMVTLDLNGATVHAVNNFRFNQAQVP